MVKPRQHSKQPPSSTMPNSSGLIFCAVFHQQLIAALKPCISRGSTLNLLSSWPDRCLDLQSCLHLQRRTACGLEPAAVCRLQALCSISVFSICNKSLPMWLGMMRRLVMLPPRLEGSSLDLYTFFFALSARVVQDLFQCTCRSLC